MAPTMRPRNILSDRLTLQEVETETLLYDERTHQAWCLNRSSACIWRLCDGRNTVSQIAAHASATLGAPVSEDLVLFTLGELRDQNLLQSDSVTVPSHALTRRQMMGRVGLAAATLLPAIAALTAPRPAAAASLGGGAGTGDGAIHNPPLR
jgi:hypothetical protein